MRSPKIGNAIREMDLAKTTSDLQSRQRLEEARVHHMGQVVVPCQTRYLTNDDD